MCLSFHIVNRFNISSQLVPFLYTYYNWNEGFILWRNRAMREVIEFRNLKEHDCTTVVERCRVLPPLPSPLFAPRAARFRIYYWVAQQ
jgi:hypothetical protein